MIGDSNDEAKFPNKLLLADTNVSWLCKAFANGSSAYTKFSKAKLSKMVQLGELIPFLNFYQEHLKRWIKQRI